MTQIGYNVEVDKAQVADAVALFEFVGGNSKDALRIAINKAGPKILSGQKKPTIVSEIQKDVRLTATFIKNNIVFAGASRSRLSGRLSAEPRGVLMARYSTDKAVQSGNAKSDKGKLGKKGGATWFKPPPISNRGIKIKIKPNGSPVTLSRDFFYMVLPKSRALGIVRRLTKSERSAAIARGSGPGSSGGKYDVLYAPSVSQVFKNGTRDKLLPRAGEVLTEQLLDAMRYLLQKKYPKE